MKKSFIQLISFFYILTIIGCGLSDEQLSIAVKKELDNKIPHIDPPVASSQLVLYHKSGSKYIGVYDYSHYEETLYGNKAIITEAKSIYVNYDGNSSGKFTYKY